MECPLVVDVKRGSTEDGPGLRSVVFFKGCPLRCCFCHNPEAQDPGPEIAFFANRCSHCGACEAACPEGAASLEAAGRLDRARCLRCGACATVCPTGALRVVGRRYEPEELADLLLRDRSYYHHSAGGVTLSGGEGTLYPRFVEACLQRVRRYDVPVLLETCGDFDYAAFSRHILPYVDEVYFDVKLADREQHRRYTGRRNDRIIENLRRLAGERSVRVQPRVPLVPGITATPTNLAAIVDLLIEAGLPSVTLLPYNPLGLSMWEALGRPRPPVPERFMSAAELEAVYAQFAGILTARTSRRAPARVAADPSGHPSTATSPGGILCGKAARGQSGTPDDGGPGEGAD